MALQTWGNNIQISNARIASVNTNDQYAMIEFDLQWDNAWRDTSNWDAAWVFVKYRATGAPAPWYHATLNYVNGSSDGHTGPGGATIRTPPDGTGVFIYRSNLGSGNANYANIQLRWNYALQGLPNASAVDIQVFGIEMVYVPSVAFYAGDGEVSGVQLYGNFETGTSGQPFYVTSEAQLTLGGGGSGSLGNNNRQGLFVHGGCPGCFDCQGDGCITGSGDDFHDGLSQTLPAAFPKGFNAFYCMKYELTQQQFVDMLNTCTSTQQTHLASQAHFYLGLGAPNSRRWAITSNLGVYSTTEPYLPIIYLDWMRGVAYADWAGLRPMTELEFEKACRGPLFPVVGEYPWGNANIELGSNLTLSNTGATNEGVASGYNSSGTVGNSWINGQNHAMATISRSGIFAAHPQNSGRVSSGATYYGIMDMGGNCWERTVTVGHPEGRKFTGLHGDGMIDATGYANVFNWPGSFSSGLVNTNIGAGYRGGGLQYPPPNNERNARVSSRRVASGYFDAVIHDDGSRFVRTAQ